MGRMTYARLKPSAAPVLRLKGVPVKGTCPCGAKYEIPANGSKLCPPCRTKREQESRKRCKERAEAEFKELMADMPKPWTPKPKRKPIMTDAEQQAHDLALADRLARECGYGCGPVRRLTREEIERVAGEITPIELIPAEREW